ncbi:hypothetical protein ACFFF5_00540 [Lederbergia wuyishanensis]|uniref:Uncharacterized protein n=1 Tax=Lederbergia wuyishanensis TaxID=1347903 RepID=A0ABU0D1Q7_9BACI|nr:hypothetical protein [Lederbergia wuyishanensis]MCJ8006936.1 hypothetical protein [Lederbergia wuyishanensis]MDQ0342320.1 hypothetical protein [Lederbergia wuyishanensis]
MRANDQNQIASFSTSQFFSLNFKNTIEKESYKMIEEPFMEYGLSMNGIRAFKKKMEKY